MYLNNFYGEIVHQHVDEVLEWMEQIWESHFPRRFYFQIPKKFGRAVKEESVVHRSFNEKVRQICDFVPRFDRTRFCNSPCSGRAYNVIHIKDIRKFVEFGRRTGYLIVGATLVLPKKSIIQGSPASSGICHLSGARFECKYVKMLVGPSSWIKIIVFRYIDGFFAKIIIYYISKLKQKGSKGVHKCGRLQRTTKEQMEIRILKRFNSVRQMFVDVDLEMKIECFDEVVGLSIISGPFGEFHFETKVDATFVVKFQGGSAKEEKSCPCKYLAVLLVSWMHVLVQIQWSF